MDHPPSSAVLAAGPVPQNRRERLLAAAEELFDEVPFDEMTVDAVADRAGVARGLVAYYFGSKAGLYAAASERFGHGVRSRLVGDDGVGGAAPWSPDEVETFLAIVQEHPTGMRNLTGSVHAARALRTPMNELTVTRVLRALAPSGASPLLELVVSSWGLHCVDLGQRWAAAPQGVGRADVAAVLVAELRGAVRAVSRAHPHLGLGDHLLA